MIRIRREPYTKYESVKAEPGGNEAEGEVYRDCEMPSAWAAIVDPDRVHWRLQTSNSGGFNRTDPWTAKVRTRTNAFGRLINPNRNARVGDERERERGGKLR